MDILFDVLYGALLGLQITACFYCTVLVCNRIDKIHKDPKVKTYHEIIAGLLILAIWTMLDPTEFPDKLGALSWPGRVIGIATTILGAGAGISVMGGDDK